MLIAYDSRAPLANTPSPHLNPQIGVLASRTFFHQGLKAPYVDVQRDTITVGTATYGNYYPAEGVDEAIESATAATIADLNRVIDELIAHRNRLAERTTVRAVDHEVIGA